MGELGDDVDKLIERLLIDNWLIAVVRKDDKSKVFLKILSLAPNYFTVPTYTGWSLVISMDLCSRCRFDPDSGKVSMWSFQSYNILLNLSYMVRGLCPGIGTYTFKNIKWSRFIESNTLLKHRNSWLLQISLYFYISFVSGVNMIRHAVILGLVLFSLSLVSMWHVLLQLLSPYTARSYNTISYVFFSERCK